MTRFFKSPYGRVLAATLVGVVVGHVWPDAGVAMKRAIGIAPIMAEAASRRQESIAKLGVSTRFGPGGPTTYRELLDTIDEPRQNRAGR